MATQTESIVAAVASALTTAGLTVRTTTGAPHSFENFPVVVVDVGNESPEGVFGGNGGLIYWNLELTLAIAALGATPKLAPETTRKTAHTALYADRTLGGLAVDILAGQVSRAIDNDNPAAGVTQCRYTIKYRIGEGTL